MVLITKELIISLATLACCNTLQRMHSTKNVKLSFRVRLCIKIPKNTVS